MLFTSKPKMKGYNFKGNGSEINMFVYFLNKW